MAIAITFRSEVHDTTGATSYATTTSFTPGARSLMIAYIWAAAASDLTDPSSVSGNGVSYTLIDSQNRGTDNRLTVWAADSGASPSNGVVTASGWGTNRTGCNIQVSEATGVNLNTGLGPGTGFAIVRTAKNTQNGQTNSTCTFGVGPDQGTNRAIAGIEKNLNEDGVPEGTWTELTDQVITAPAESLTTAWRSDAFDPTAVFTWTTLSNYGEIALEINEGTVITPTRKLRVVTSPQRW